MPRGEGGRIKRIWGKNQVGEKGREREEGKGRGLMGMAQKGKRIEGEGIGKGEKREMEGKARGNRREKGSEREENRKGRGREKGRMQV